MGGKNPLVVVDDADVELAATVAVQGAFFSAGQRCTASSRLIVTEGIHDRGRRRGANDAPPSTMLAGRDGHRSGHSRRQLAQNLDYVEIGKNEGACLLRGGERLEPHARFLHGAGALHRGVERHAHVT